MIFLRFITIIHCENTPVKKKYVINVFLREWKTKIKIK